MAEAAVPTVAEELITGCFQAVLDRSDFSVSSERMVKTRALAENLLEAVKTEEGRKALETFSRGVSEKMVEVINKSEAKKFSNRRVKLWRQFHNIRTTKLKDLYVKFLAEVSITTGEDPLLIQYTFEKMFEETLKWQFTSETDMERVAELTSNDHQALRYAAGFIPHALMKKISRGSHPFKGSFLSCLSSMGTKGRCPDETVETYQSFTKKWITAVNRGGLFFVSDEVYTFFFYLEKKTRSYLPELIRQGKVNKAVVLGEITADDSV